MKSGKGVNVHHHRIESMDGKTRTLADWSGQVLMLVNVASKCGLTPQYEQLVEIHKKYGDQGFAVLGFPANNFMSQEPGSNEEIKTFCSTTYGVDFDVLSKISVAGDDIDPLYAALTSTDVNGELGGDIEWNFAKFIVNKQGDVVARIHPKTLPNDADVIACIESELQHD
ncbi:MAG: glutathione peroxidase [Candidatus Hydrogenedentota bacterium]